MVPVPGVSVDDLDAGVLKRFRVRAAKSKRLGADALEEDDAGLIEKLRLMEGRYLKRAAVLLFHPDPERFLGSTPQRRCSCRGVYPPKGRVRVAAPFRLDDEVIRLAVISRLGWIRRQQQSFIQQDRQSQREMATGESHYFQGRRYRLAVIEYDGPPSIGLPNNTIMELRVRPGTDRDGRETVLHRWYRRRLRDQFPGLLTKWEPQVGVEVG